MEGEKWKGVDRVAQWLDRPLLNHIQPHLILYLSCCVCHSRMDKYEPLEKKKEEEKWTDKNHALDYLQ